MDARTGFSDSNDLSGGSSSVCYTATAMDDPTTTPPSEISALTRLSDTLESIFDSPTPSEYFSDAKISVAGGTDVAVHRCILSARSPFFKAFFGSKERNVKMELKDFAKDYELGFDSVVSVLGYLYSGRIRALPKDVCVCVDDECLHIACRPVLDFMLQVLYASFIFQIPELVSLWQGRLLDVLGKAVADDILVVLSVANICGKACEELLMRCMEIVVKSDVDFVTLDRALPEEIVKQLINSRFELGLDEPESISFPDKHVKRIHRALDSDDVELVRMLLKEGHTTLDDACALHYAVAYGDAKTTTELLDLSLADVNHKNQRGYTVLHVAATRKEPKIIVSLLTKGADPYELTPDGRKALQISKRLTRSVDYYMSTEKGKESPKDRLCIEILEQAEGRAPLLGEASVSLAIAGDDLRMKLLYLENRVGLAKLLFPTEAKVAMEIAQVDGTSEFQLSHMMNTKKMPNRTTVDLNDAPFKIKDEHLKRLRALSKTAKVAMEIAQVDGTSEFQLSHMMNTKKMPNRTTVDLNDAPFKIKDEHLKRLRALSKTVELGKRFFPRCSEVLNKIMDADDLSELCDLGEEGSQDERQQKKQRYMELQDVLTKAFTEDKEEFGKCYSIASSSSSTTSLGLSKVNNSKFPFKKE